jgi:hypothetical protein
LVKDDARYLLLLASDGGLSRGGDRVAPFLHGLPLVLTLTVTSMNSLRSAHKRGCILCSCHSLKCKNNAEELTR